ncbi:hypothetical protein HELRODRAFT_191111 [Helobdella robusta]|uniref:DUF4190 domain-containing protein n=1 Tax=Helobdella robusta TaxID=6412 RepID=T1FSL7_HELRO|nr:hypothetical protein HELRODRAFT_191111 [Helobdella robusta]ESO07254.1 hypothetical protein HELRODRAFT_191111 [Helobdella robusta]
MSLKSLPPGYSVENPNPIPYPHPSVPQPFNLYYIQLSPQQTARQQSSPASPPSSSEQQQQQRQELPQSDPPPYVPYETDPPPIYYAPHSQERLTHDTDGSSGNGGSGGQETNVRSRTVSTNNHVTGAIILSALVFLFFGCIFGLCALIYAILGKQSASRGDYRTAWRHIIYSYILSFFGFIVGLSTVIIFIIYANNIHSKDTIVPRCCG